MRELIAKYTNWLHTRWPAGRVEVGPRVREDFSTNVPGVYVVGDLAGVPLLKYSLNSGAEAVRTIAAELAGARNNGRRAPADRVDVAILGAGVAGMSAVVEASKLNLSHVVVEGTDRFATIRDFPKGKPIYTYPTEMEPASDLVVQADVKEALLSELLEQTDDVPVHHGRAEYVRRGSGCLEVVLEDGEVIRARRVVVAIGRTGHFRTLDVPGEEAEHVHYRLHDPSDFADRDVLVAGGGDSALETAILLAEQGAQVTLSYRGNSFVRAKPENIERLRLLESSPTHALEVIFESRVTRIDEDQVSLETHSGTIQIPSEIVFVMIGREAPLDFFRRSGIRLRNDWGTRDRPNWRMIGGMAAFMTFMAVVYNWTSGGFLHSWGESAQAFPFWISSHIREADIDVTSWPGVILESAHAPAFWYTLAYSIIVVTFGLARIKRRKTPYIKLQTWTLMSIQVIPLFILPEILLPYAGYHALLPQGMLDGLFPVSEYATHGREYWRAYGFILAWPLLVYNVFTQEPLVWWLTICFIQTFVLIPGMIYFWGKGAYCGWICSCGALAETLGDTQRDKMPHGPGWNKFNMVGQVLLALVLFLLILRIVGWIWPDSVFDGVFNWFMFGDIFGIQFNYEWVVDVIMAGVIGYGVYFWLSGRFWCRFLCPLAALMNIYTRFSRFRILAEKEKCISCNVCTSVCHQGIDVMSFAQRGLPMEDPQCVRCSACVQSCPTGVLSFGQIDTKTGQVITTDQLEASLTRLLEKEKKEVAQPAHHRSI